LTTNIDDLEAWFNERGIQSVTELVGAVKDDDIEIDTRVAASSGIGQGASVISPSTQAVPESRRETDYGY